MRTRTQTKTAAMAMGRAASETRNHASIDYGRASPSVAPLPSTRGRTSSLLVSELEFFGCDPLSVNYDQYVLLREAKRRFELWDRHAGIAWEVSDGPAGIHEWPIQALKEVSQAVK